jgi:hypothetical protein
MENFPYRFKRRNTRDQERHGQRDENMEIRARSVYLRASSELESPNWKDSAMQMVDLILLACALTNPSACREHHLLFQTAGTLQGCVFQAQPYLAQWAGDHPGFRVASWRCAWPDQEEEKG